MAIHYPLIIAEPVKAIRAEQHEDINLIILLAGASADELQILNDKNEWIIVTSLPEQIVVNVGNIFQRLTNNKLYSTTQRFVNRDRALWHTSRFSIPYFLHQKSSMCLRCLDFCIDASPNFIMMLQLVNFRRKITGNRTKKIVLEIIIWKFLLK